MATARLFYKPSELIDDRIKPRTEEGRAMFNDRLNEKLKNEFGLLEMEYTNFKLFVDELNKALEQFDAIKNGKQSADEVDRICKMANEYLAAGLKFKRETLLQESHSPFDSYLLDVRLAIPKKPIDCDQLGIFEPLKKAMKEMNLAVDEATIQRELYLANECYNKWKYPHRKRCCTII